jgi:ATP diphosphatase
METIVTHTLEEAYEVADAVRENDMEALKSELGDLLLQVVFYSQLAEEKKLFAFDDVVESICSKLVHRHPHVFGDVEVTSVEQQNEIWEHIKEQERQDGDSDSGALDGVATSLPSLLRAYKLQKRAETVGFDWPDHKGALEKILEEVEEVKDAVQSNGDVKEEVGDLLFAVANLSRKLDIEPEAALRAGNRKFERRFKAMEQNSGGTEAFKSLSLDSMEALWKQVKNSDG